MDDGNQSLKDLQRQIAKLTESIGKMAGDQKVPTFGEFALSYAQKKESDPTLRASTKRLFAVQVHNHLIPAFGEFPLNKVTGDEWLRWVSRIREENKNPEQKKRPITRFFNMKKYLVEVLTAAKEDGHIEKVPKIANPDEPKNTGRVLEDKEVIAILWRTRRPFRRIFWIFWKLGCRPREILQWEWSMITWGEPGKTWIAIPARISKTDRNRSIPLHPDVSAALFRRAKDLRFVFPNEKKNGMPILDYHFEWARACRLAGVLDAVVYDFRRTFITSAMSEGKSAVFISKLLDTSVKMVEAVYTKTDAKTMENLYK